jgi:hypothetical protein
MMISMRLFNGDTAVQTNSRCSGWHLASKQAASKQEKQRHCYGTRLLATAGRTSSTSCVEVSEASDTLNHGLLIVTHVVC